MSSKTEIVRKALRQSGRLTAQEIADQTSIPARLVGALLGNEIRQGRVISQKNVGKPVIYVQVDQHQLAIEKSIKFLQSAGFEVRKKEC